MTSAPSNSPAEPIAITAERILVEQLAITLYHDAIRQERHLAGKLKTPKPEPRWVDLGTQIRQAYRAAAYQLLEEN